MIRFTDIATKEARFLAMTGLRVGAFLALVPFFKRAYEESEGTGRTLGGAERQRKAGGGAKSKLETIEDKLLFILNYHKNNGLQEAQGALFGLSQARANIWIHRLLPILQRGLALAEATPCREGKALLSHPLAKECADDNQPPVLAIDGTERPRTRPKNDTEQQDTYSGKKKQHTRKNTIISNKHTGKIAYLGPTVTGKTHDKKMADAEEITFPQNTILYKDTGYQGFEPPDVITKQPKKNRKTSL